MKTLDKLFHDYARKVHLSQAQVELLAEIVRKHGKVRPTTSEYEAYQEQMRQLMFGVAHPRSIPHTTPGIDRSSFRLDAEFDARDDLPEGLGVFSFHDSGGNHGVSSAGKIILTNLWNSWGCNSRALQIVRNLSDPINKR